MKHVKIFEEFQDEVSPEMRDLFGMRDRFTLEGKKNLRSRWIGKQSVIGKFEGPSEYSNEVRAIASKALTSPIDPIRLTQELAKRGWKGEAIIPIDGPYEVKGPFANFRGALQVRAEVIEEADHGVYKAEKTGDESEDELDEAYGEVLAFAMKADDTIQEFTDLGYTIIDKEDY